MSCWGYRVVKNKNNSLDIRRVFDQSDDIIGIGEYPEKVKAESIDGLLVMLREMIDCLSQPVIDYNTGEEI